MMRHKLSDIRVNCRSKYWKTKKIYKWSARSGHGRTSDKGLSFGFGWGCLGSQARKLEHIRPFADKSQGSTEGYTRTRRNRRLVHVMTVKYALVIQNGIVERNSLFEN